MAGLAENGINVGCGVLPSVPGKMDDDGIYGNDGNRGTETRLPVEEPRGTNLNFSSKGKSDTKGQADVPLCFDSLTPGEVIHGSRSRNVKHAWHRLADQVWRIEMILPPLNVTRVDHVGARHKWDTLTPHSGNCSVSKSSVGMNYTPVHSPKNIKNHKPASYLRTLRSCRQSECTQMRARIRAK